MTYDPVDANDDGTVDADVDNELVNTDRLHTDSAEATYVVYKRDGTIYADARKDGYSSFEGSDFSTILQSASDSLSKNDSVLIKSGQYTVSSLVTFSTDGVTIRGEGHSTRLNQSSNNNNMLKLDGDVFDCTISNLLLEANGESGTAIEIAPASTSIIGQHDIHSLLIEGFNKAIFINGSPNDSHIRDCIINRLDSNNRCQYGLHVVGASGIHVTNCFFRHCAVRGIKFDEDSGTYPNEILINGIGLAQVSVSEVPNYRSIELLKCGSTAITNVYPWRPVDAGIYIKDSSKIALSNITNQSESHGPDIVLDNAKQTAISNLTLQNAATGKGVYGIESKNGSTVVSIQNGSIKGYERAAYLEDPQFITLNGLQIRNSNQEAIKAYGTGTTAWVKITDCGFRGSNQANNSGVAAIDFADVSGRNVNVSDCQFIPGNEDVGADLGSNISDSRLDSNLFDNYTTPYAASGARVKVDGVIAGGFLQGTDIGSLTGATDGDVAMADGTTATNQYALFVHRDAGDFIRVDGGATITPS